MNGVALRMIHFACLCLDLQLAELAKAKYEEANQP